MLRLRFVRGRMRGRLYYDGGEVGVKGLVNGADYAARNVFTIDIGPY